MAFTDELAAVRRPPPPGPGPGPACRRCSAGPRNTASPTCSWPTSGAAAKSISPQMRREHGVTPVYKLVDTCAAEFEAYTPYFYSTYEWEDEVRKTAREKVMILGGGPNRIGQGIEFDYCCCHASFALKEMGIESIMVNSNPETVSTDYDTSDKLYFEPLTLEDVLNIAAAEKPRGPHRPVRRPDPPEPGGAPGPGRGAHPGHLRRRHRPGRGPQALQAASDQAGPQAAPQRHRHAPWSKPWRSPTASATRCWCGPPTCWAAGPWRSWPTTPGWSTS